MPSPATTDELLDLLRKSRLLSSDKLSHFLEERKPLPVEPQHTITLLIKAKLLTTFQAKLLLSGKYKGFHLGSYIIQHELGKGGMGTVYLGRQEQTGKIVAIKVLTPGGNQLTIERFLREARSAARLDHPNIVKMIEVDKDGDVYYLIMEYIDGMTLDRIVALTGPVAISRAVDIMAQTAIGLQHAWERGIVHRDIKPSNLMLSRQGLVKILDMGLARTLKEDDQLTEMLDSGAVVGTADYISPEQAMSSHQVDIRSDLYSLGATFFALVAGRPPFLGNAASKLAQHQMKDPPVLHKLDPTIPKTLSRIVQKLLAKKPQDRFQTPIDLVRALKPWLVDDEKLQSGILRTEVGSTGRLPIQRKRTLDSNKLMIGLMVAIILASVLLLGLFLWA